MAPLPAYEVRLSVGNLDELDQSEISFLAEGARDKKLTYDLEVKSSPLQ